MAGLASTDAVRIIATVHQPRQWLLVTINLAARLVAWLTFGVFFRVERRGRRNLPGDGGVLVISNHISWFDPPLLNIALRRIPHWLAMMELFQSKFTHWFFTSAGVIPIDRGQPGSGPLKEAIRRLRAGHVVVLFPEGGIQDGPRSVLGGDPVIKEGAALIALKAGVPIVPAIIEGARQSYIRQNWFFRRCAIRLTLGEPFHLPPKCDRAGAHAMIREKLLGLATETRQGRQG
ncbi:MAG: lysophospholipid acyltransferase family protein [Verrucomicrobia bacterium]|nr:lysophospholipid acyltransferase family protein [Verrucomicrobiota bacterium]